MMKVISTFVPIRAFGTKRNKKFVENFKNRSDAYSGRKMKYVKSGDGPNPGIDNRLKMFREDEKAAGISASHEFNDLHEDVDEFESDFMNAGESHRMHERELKIRKDKLKNMITYSKYIKEVEPSFLTFAEKEQIKSLHESDPQGWSVEKLSESFPALPHTIKKVLHAKWAPKSVETVLRYDEKVISNWEAFRAGELPLSPGMEKHLQHFNDRQIILTDREELAKRFIPPKMKFPKPKSRLFSNIAAKYLLPSSEIETASPDENSDIENNNDTRNRNTDLERKKSFNDNNTDFKNKNIKAHKNLNDNRRSSVRNFEEQTAKNENRISLPSQNVNDDDFMQNKKRVTFGEFLKRSVDRTKNSTSPEDIVLKETYKKHMEKKSLFESKPAAISSYSSTDSEKEETISGFEASRNAINLSLSGEKEEDSKSHILTERTDKHVVSGSIPESETVQISRAENQVSSSGLNKSALGTYVKEWLKNEIDEDVPFYPNSKT